MKNFLCMFLSIMMLASVLPMVVSADDAIRSVVILDIDEPVDGAPYDRFAKLPSGQPYQIFAEPEWYDETDGRFLEMGDTFEAGHVYTVSVWIEANPGYEFLSTATTTDVTASINGKKAEAGKAFEYQRWAMVVVSYTFPAVEVAKPVGTVTIKIAKPKAGEAASFDATITGEGVKLMERIPDLSSVYQNAINGIEWEDRTINHSLSEGETFIIGHEYGLSIFIEPEAGYKLDDSSGSYSVTINGVTPLPIDGFGEDRRGYYISYDCFGEVGEVSFNVVEPEMGHAPYNDIIPISPHVERDVTDIIYFDMSERDWPDTNTPFKEGHYYRVTFRATAKDGYIFTPNEDGSLDESKILVNEHPVTEAYYFSTWDRSYLQVTCIYPALQKGEKPLPVPYDKSEIKDGILQCANIYDISEPKAGELPDQVGVTLAKDYRVPHFEGGKTAFRWINVTDGVDMDLEKDRFEEGKEYEVQIGLATYSTALLKTDANGNALFKAYIDGKEVDRITVLDEQNAYLYYNFGVLGEENKPEVTEAPVATETPTEAPVVTEQPTEQPTEKPTEAPVVTEKPTEVLTAKPTEKPTEKPQATEHPEKITFTDVAKGEYYYDPVMWAVEEGITSGTSPNTFSPSSPCTRAQVVTFLHRMVGSPMPAAISNPFADVADSAYYYDPVLWAFGSKITGGTSETTFSPDSPCTRAQVVTFLWRCAGEPMAKGEKNPFVDVEAGSYYYDAVLWAVEEGITGGTSATTFSPDSPCTRAQVVTFLYRFINE